MTIVDDWLRGIALLSVYLLAAWFAMRFFRKGLTDIRAGLRLRRQALLGELSDESLMAPPETMWPTRGRWPGPNNHPEELDGDMRRQTYARLARHHAIVLERRAEVLKLAGTAIGSIILYNSIREVLSFETPSVTNDLLAFLPSLETMWAAITAMLPGAIVVLTVPIVIAVEARSEYFNSLAVAYDTYPGQVSDQQEPRPMSRFRSWLRRLAVRDIDQPET
jgi:hypothetical protein